MVNGLWGKKIGMTQVFSDDHKVVPVTVIDIADWYVTQVKTKERDGYDALQLGCIKKKYAGQDFSTEWLKKPQAHFSVLKEVRLVNSTEGVTVGQKAPDVAQLLVKGENVDIFGTSFGRGFQGGVKRHGFHGGRGSHGDKLGRGPGSIGSMHTRGRVIKGKKMPGHMGVEACVIKNLEVVKVESSANVILVKGSVPGKTGSLVFVKKRELSNG